MLRQLVTRDLDIEQIEDSLGLLRVVLIVPHWEEYVSVAVDEVLYLKPMMPQVRRRLEVLLSDMLAIAPPSRTAELKARRERLASLKDAA